jgi:hypothetical protein
VSPDGALEGLGGIGGGALSETTAAAAAAAETATQAGGGRSTRAVSLQASQMQNSCTPEVYRLNFSTATTRTACTIIKRCK